MTIPGDRSGGPFNNEDGARIASLTDLMKLYDEGFVEQAYLVMLGRTADAVGLRYYAARLRSGHSRISVLDQLSKSAEAKGEWNKVAGLSEAIRLFRKSRSMRGWKLALTDLEFGRTPAIRRARALQNVVASQSQQMDKSLLKLAAQQDSLKILVSQFVDVTPGASHGGTGRVDARNLAMITPEFRSRAVEEVRDFDLPATARNVLGALRF